MHRLETALSLGLADNIAQGWVAGLDCQRTVFDFGHTVLDCTRIVLAGCCSKWTAWNGHVNSE